MSLSPTAARRVAFPPNWPTRIGFVVLAVYVVYASRILDITWARFIAGIDHGGKFLARMFPPNVAHDKLQLLYAGMAESLQIAVLATAFGIALSLPLGLAAARNLAAGTVGKGVERWTHWLRLLLGARRARRG